jgi:V/A-type H+-transporting ATPase subunit C
MAGCDYANARVRAMEGRLLGRKGILELLARPDLSARLASLAQTDYGEAIAAHLKRTPDPLQGAERGLRARLMDDLTRIDRFLRGERVQSLFRAMLAFEDGWNLKTILRGIARRERPERLFLLLAPTPALDDPALQELSRQTEVKAALDLLATWWSPYAPPLREAFPAYLRRREVLFLEVALDRFLFARALEAARRDGEDGRLFQAFLDAQIDLINVGTLLKGGGGEFFIPGGRLMSANRFREYATLGAQGLRETLGREGPLALAAGLLPLEELGDPSAVDQLLHRILRERIRREARIHPLSLAVPLAFILERQAEVRRIRLVLRATEFGLPAEELLDRIER